MTTMDYTKTLQALKNLKVQTGSLACLGCGHEYNCSTHGCAILRNAVEHMEAYHPILIDLDVLNRTSGDYARVFPEITHVQAALAKPTEPLTQEDLNKMFLETVWLQYPDGSGEPALVVNGRIYSADNLEGAGLDLEEYCQGESLDSRTGEYRVYLRPPEEGGSRHGG